MGVEKRKDSHLNRRMPVGCGEGRGWEWKVSEVQKVRPFHLLAFIYIGV